MILASTLIFANCHVLGISGNLSQKQVSHLKMQCVFSCFIFSIVPQRASMMKKDNFNNGVLVTVIFNYKGSGSNNLIYILCVCVRTRACRSFCFKLLEKLGYHSSSPYLNRLAYTS